MAAPKGNKYSTGRPKGSINRESRIFLDALTEAVEAMQADPDANIIAWGKKNPNEFWKIASKLLPNRLQAELDVTSGGEPISISVNAGREVKND